MPVRAPLGGLIAKGRGEMGTRLGGGDVRITINVHDMVASVERCPYEPKPGVFAGLGGRIVKPLDKLARTKATKGPEGHEGCFSDVNLSSQL